MTFGFSPRTSSTVAWERKPYKVIAGGASVPSALAGLGNAAGEHLRHRHRVVRHPVERSEHHVGGND